MRPAATIAVVSGTTLRVTFSEALGAAASLTKDSFTVKKTPQNGSETSVVLSGTPAISGNTLTLTLASAVLATDSAVKLSYAAPTTGTGNRLVDAVGNEVADFEVKVNDSRPGAPEAPTVTAHRPSSVKVSWTAPDMTGKPAIIDYDVRWFKGSSNPNQASQWTEHDHDGTLTNTTITGLDPGSAYRVQVRAQNADGEGDWSASGQGQTSSTSAPTGCGSGGNADNWFASVTSTSTTITVTLSSPLPATIAGFIWTSVGPSHPVRPVHSLRRTVPTIGVLSRGQSTRLATTLPGPGQEVPRQSLQAGTDYWVRLDPYYGHPEGPWHYVRTKANFTPVIGSDAPTTLTVAENSAAGTAVGTVAATDANAEDTLSYSLASQEEDGTDHESFAIDADGRITVAQGATLDYERQSSYALTVQVHDGRNAKGEEDTTVDASHDLTVTVTDVLEVSSVELVSTPAAGQNNTYKLGDTVRARVTFDAAVDVVGDPVLKLQFDPNFGEKSMTFDASKGRTNVTALEFTWTIIADNISTRGIAFYANKLSVGTDVSIKLAGTEEDAPLAFAKVDHNPAHKVDGVLPALVATNAVVETTSAGTDQTYAIGETVDFTATFTEAVTVETAGTPVAGPRLAFLLLNTEKYAVYDSGSGSNKLVFRYTVQEGDGDHYIAVGENALSLNGGAIADAAGNAATATQIRHSAVPLGNTTDGSRPTAASARVLGTKLWVTFSERLGSASLTNDAFTVKKTPQNAGETQVNLTGSPAISDNRLTLTLASEVLTTDSAVKVSYTKPTTGTGNRLVDSAGNEAHSFTRTVPRITRVSEVKLVSTPTLDLDGDSTAETYKAGDTVRARVTFDTAVDVVGNPVLRLQLAPNSGERSMTFDHSGGRKNLTELHFSYTVATGDLSTQGIAFFANKLSAGNGASIRGAGTQVDASLSFAKVDHNVAHKVDAVAPELVATDPISVTSSAGADDIYVIGETIDFTATFNRAVTVTPAGNPVTGPRLAFRMGAATKHAAYKSGSGTAVLVFSYTVAEGDADSDGISVGSNSLSLNGGVIADAIGNAATAAQLEHSALGALTDHKVDGVRPTATGAAAVGTVLRVAFNKPLGAAANISNGAFAVKRNGSAVNLSGSPAIRANGVTLTLASGVAATDTVTVSYVKPTAGTGNRLVDTVGNEVASFADMTVVDGRPGTPARPTVATHTPSTLRVNWTAPDMTGKPAITGYDVRWFKGSQDPSSASQWKRHHHAGTGTGRIITGLEPSGTYRVQVRARNAVGEGGWSVSGSGATSSSSAPPACGSISSSGRWFASFTSSSKTITFTYSTNFPNVDEENSPTAFVDVCWPSSAGSNQYRNTRWADSIDGPRAGGSYTIDGHGTLGTGPSKWRYLQSGTDYWVRFRHADRDDNGQPIVGQWRYVRTKPNFVPAFGSNEPAALTVAENSAAGTAVGTVAATDRNAEDTVSYSLASQASNGTDHESFAIDAAGRITVAAGATLDHETQSRYALAVQVQDGRNAAGIADTAVDASRDLTVTVTNAVEVTAVDLVSTPTVDADGDDTAETYTPGDTVRARVTFDAAVDVVGNPVLELDFDPAAGGEKSMTFDDSKGRTNLTALDFTYTVAEGDLSTQGIGFQANKLSAGQGGSIKVAGTSQDAPLAFAAVDHNSSHKVDGVLPELIATDPVRVTSSAGTDNTYAIGDAIDISATFTEAVTVTTAGDPVTGPRLSFTLGNAAKHAVYHSGTGTTALVFRYNVAENDADADGISVERNVLAANGGAIEDAAGNSARLGHAALAALADHKVEGVRPTVTDAVVSGTALSVTFSEALGTASLANGDFTVKRTSGGSESTVALSGSPAIDGNTLTLTLASELAPTDTGVKVSYVKPTTGTGNRLVDAVGNEAESFANRAVTRLAKVSEIKLVSAPTVDADGDDTAETYKVGDTVRARVSFDAAVDVTGNPVLKLDFDSADGGEKSMTFDATGGRTNLVALDFTYTVGAGDLSTEGIGFNANKLSAGQG